MCLDEEDGVEEDAREERRASLRAARAARRNSFSSRWRRSVGVSLLWDGEREVGSETGRTGGELARA